MSTPHTHEYVKGASGKVETCRWCSRFRIIGGEPIIEQLEPTAWEHPPARVHGTEGGAVAFFITDAKGDLVDLEFECTDCALTAGHDNGERLPGFDWSPDYDSYCRECGAVVNKGRNAE